MTNTKQAWRPKKRYPVTGEAARKARYRAKQAQRKHAGPSNPYVSTKGKEYDRRALRCKCEIPWHGGEGRCAKCGKELR